MWRRSIIYLETEPASVNQMLSVSAQQQIECMNQWVFVCSDSKHGKQTRNMKTRSRRNYRTNKFYFAKPFSGWRTNHGPWRPDGVSGNLPRVRVSIDWRWLNFNRRTDANCLNIHSNNCTEDHMIPGGVKLSAPISLPFLTLFFSVNIVWILLP